MTKKDKDAIMAALNEFGITHLDELLNPADLTKRTKEDKNILEEAANLVDLVREVEYGGPKPVFQDIAKFWEAYLGDVQISAHDVCIMMTLLKLAREKHRGKRDNLVDAVGYLRVYERLSEDDGEEISGPDD